MTTSILKLALLFPLISGEPDFSLTLAYYTRPLIHKQWEIHIFRRNKTITIQNTNYLDTRYTRTFPYAYYTTLLSKLDRLGVWSAKDHYYAMSENEYYLLTITSRTRQNIFKIEARVPAGGKYAQYRTMIRLIENYTRLMIPEK